MTRHRIVKIVSFRPKGAGALIKAPRPEARRARLAWSSSERSHVIWEQESSMAMRSICGRLHGPRTAAGSAHSRPRCSLDGDERRLSRCHRKGHSLRAHQPRHLWASRLTTSGLTRPFPFVSVPRDRRDSRRMRGQEGNVADDLHSAHELGPSSTPGPGVILGSDVTITERNPVGADAADPGGATGVPAASAVRSRKESTRDAE